MKCTYNNSTQVIWRITVNPTKSIFISAPIDAANAITIIETSVPALYKFILDAGKTYELTNTSDDTIDIRGKDQLEGQNERFDYVIYRKDGTINTYGQNAQWVRCTFNNSSQVKWIITVNPTYGINCYLPYEQAAYISGIPTPVGGFIN